MKTGRPQGPGATPQNNDTYRAREREIDRETVGSSSAAGLRHTRGAIVSHGPLPMATYDAKKNLAIISSLFGCGHSDAAGFVSKDGQLTMSRCFWRWKRAEKDAYLHVIMVF